MKYSSSLLLLISLLMPFPSSNSASGGRREVEWGNLTKMNFTSQIRAHNHILLLVTVPWCGESRSIAKELSHLVANRENEFGYLKLMVLYRNSEKILANAIGASEGISLFYFHHSTSYKYNGKLRSQNILSSIYNFMLLHNEEIPLKPLKTLHDIENLFQSTDKAVVLVEFCGWSRKLLHRRNYEVNERTKSFENQSETVGLLEENLSREGEEVASESTENQKIDYSDSLESTTPPNQPSLILFIDRSSESSRLRGESSSALQTLRKFVKDNGLSSTPNQFIPRHSQHKTIDHLSPRLDKFKDNMAVMVLNKGQMVSLDAISGDQDYAKDPSLNELPSIFLMDCTLNDCGTLLKPVSKEVYPKLMLFPAENKTAVIYDGDMSVASIFEFLISSGRNSGYLNRQKGVLWTPSWKGSNSYTPMHDKTIPINNIETLQTKEREDMIPTTKNYHIMPGSILAATDKLVNTITFNNATILIVKADTNQGFQGLIINKPINWDIFKQLDSELEALKRASLFYGGPVSAQDFPLVSLTRNEFEGYVKVVNNLYFGGPLATGLAVGRIKSGDAMAEDFRFYVGYSSWGWEQLFEELEGGAWSVSESNIGNLDLPLRMFS